MTVEAAAWRTLELDLGSGKTTISDDKPRFLGGRGENYSRLLKLGLPDAMGASASPLLFASGPLVGTGFPGASRINVAARSPITQGIGSSSAGSGFSAKMRLAGFELVVLQGKAINPVYLVLKSGRAELKDARPIWGQTVSEADAWLRNSEGQAIATAIIGPAGERGGAAAAVLFNARRAGGRCALGAVMGLKQLKAIVVKGEGRLQVAIPSKFQQIEERLLRAIDTSAHLEGIKKHGTFGISPIEFEPIKNFQEGRLSPTEQKAIGSDRFKPYFVKQYGCPECPVECGRQYHVRSGRFSGSTSSGLHANTITDFGTRLAIFDPEVIIAAHGLCNDYGLDIDNASGVIAWAMEAFQRGLLTQRDTEGLELGWGNGEVVLKLLHKIAYREGIGDLLAEGCKKASLALGLGSDDFCMAIKGQELEEIVRPYKGWALGIVVSERGGTHTRGAPVSELGGEIPADIAVRAGLPGQALAADSYEGKPEVVIYYERLHAVLDGLGICYMISDWSDPKLPSFSEFAQALSAATGEDFTTQRLVELGEEIHTLGRLINVAYVGFSRHHDYPPRRLMEEELETGQALRRDRWDQMLDRYYRLHGWDLQTGWPTTKTLKKLGLTEFEWTIGRR